MLLKARLGLVAVKKRTKTGAIITFWVRPEKVEKKVDKIYNSLMKQIDKYVQIEKKKVDYPDMASVKDLFQRVYDATTHNKIKIATAEFDSYLKRGLEWKISYLPEADVILPKLHEYAMNKRRKIFPSYDLSSVKELRSYYSKLYGGNKDLSNYKHHMRLVNGIEDTLKSPEIIGLYEESQFNTLKREIKWDIGLIKKTYKTDPFGIPPKVEQILKEIESLKEKS